VGTLIVVAALTLAAWLVLSAVGAAILVHVPLAMRDHLWPAAPLIGFIAIALGLSWVGLVLPVGVAVWPVLAAVLALGVWSWWRTRRPLASPAALRLTLMTWLVSVVPLGVALGPLALTQSLLTRVTTNNDAFFYISNIEWFQGHSIREVPKITSRLAGDAVAYAPVVSSDEGQLRVGSELVHSALNSLLQIQAQNSWYTWMVLAAPMAVAGVVAAMRLLGVRPLPAVASGLVVGSSTLIAYQLFNANAPAALGAAFTPLVFVCAGLAIRAGSDRPPLWLAALLCTGLVGVYTELLPFLAPPLGIYALWLLRREPRRVSRTVGLLLLLCFSISPYFWLRAARSLLFLTGAQSGQQASFWVEGSWWSSVMRVVGVSWAGAPPDLTQPLTHGIHEATGLALALALVVGIGAVLAQSPLRVLVGAAVLWVPALLAWLYLDGRYYVFDRGLLITGPLIVFFACLGWAGLAARRSLSPSRDGVGLPAEGAWSMKARSERVAMGLSAVALAVALAAVTANVISSAWFVKGAREGYLPVDAAYGEAAAWVDEFGANNGAGVSVASADFWQQLWLTYTLRQERTVDWVSLDPSYLRVRYHTDGEIGRWLLMDTGVVTQLAPSAVVRQNAKFRLVDLEAAPAVVGVPCCLSEGQWYPAEQVEGATVRRMTNGGEVTIVNVDGADDSVGMLLRPQQALEPLPVEASLTDLPGQGRSGTVLRGDGELSVNVPGRLSRWRLVSSRPPTAVNGGPTYSVILEGMRP
jgi:hypothetical protein